MKITDGLEELRAEFAKVNLKDKESVQKWFAEYTYLSSNEHAIIANRSIWWIRNLRRFAGITAKTKCKPPGSKTPKKVIDFEIPENWDNKEWLEKVLQTNSLLSVHRALKVPLTTLHTKVKRYGIKLPDHTSSKNPCCSYEWCYNHYVTKKLSQEQCAKLASVSRTTFRQWLVKFNIPSRKQNKTNLLWVQQLIHKLKQQLVVNKIMLRNDHVHVRFKNFFWETYYFADPGKRVVHSFRINKEMAKLENVPIVKLEYEAGLTDDGYPAHIIIPRHEFDAASFLEQRIALHNMCWTLARRGWVPMDYPKSVLQADWDRITQRSLEGRFLRDSRYHATVNTGQNETAGWRISEHFLPYREYERILKSPRLVTRALNNVAKKNIKINTHNMLRMLVLSDTRFISLEKPRFKIVDPRMYISMFRRLGVSGKVLDIYPNHGYRLMACAKLGLTYVAKRTEQLEYAVDKGLLEFLDLNLEWYEGQQVDWAIHDDDLLEHPLSEIDEILPNAKRLLHFVHRFNRKKVEAQVSPDTIVPVQERRRKTPDYFFLF